jgi:hypothetical protein
MRRDGRIHLVAKGRNVVPLRLHRRVEARSPALQRLDAHADPVDCVGAISRSGSQRGHRLFLRPDFFVQNAQLSGGNTELQSSDLPVETVAVVPKLPDLFLCRVEREDHGASVKESAQLPHFRARRANPAIGVGRPAGIGAFGRGKRGRDCLRTPESPGGVICHWGGIHKGRIGGQSKSGFPMAQHLNGQFILSFVSPPTASPDVSPSQADPKPD